MFFIVKIWKIVTGKWFEFRDYIRPWNLIVQIKGLLRRIVCSDFHSGCWNVSHHKRSFSGTPFTWTITFHWAQAKTDHLKDKTTAWSKRVGLKGFLGQTATKIVLLSSNTILNLTICISSAAEFSNNRPISTYSDVRDWLLKTNKNTKTRAKKPSNRIKETEPSQVDLIMIRTKGS